MSCFFSYDIWLSPSWRVEQLYAQQGNEGCPHGSPSDLHGNLVGRLHLGKSAVLLRIHTDRSHPLAYQRGPSSPQLHLLGGTDPKRTGRFYELIFSKQSCFFLTFCWVCFILMGFA